MSEEASLAHLNKSRLNIHIRSDLYFFVQFDDVLIEHSKTAMRDGATAVRPPARHRASFSRRWREADRSCTAIKLTTCWSTGDMKVGLERLFG